MMQTAHPVTGACCGANLDLLFWLSLFPFMIRWIDERGVTSFPVAAFGVVLAMAGDCLLPARTGADRGRGRGFRVAAGGRERPRSG